MVFVHESGQEFPWGGLVVLWDIYDFLALHDRYFGVVDGLCSADLVCDNWTVPDLVLLDGLFLSLCRRPS